MGVTPTAIDTWTCPTCNLPVITPYCSTCGECPPSARDLTLRGFLEHFARGLTNIDSRLILSFRCLITRPGALTKAYVRGQRKLYNTPLQVFFLANIFFFAVHIGTEAKVFSAPLVSHLHTQPWSVLAEGLVTSHLEKANTTLERYTPVFDKAVASHAKSLVILMILPFALLSPIFFRKSHSPFVAHVVFSLHLYAFLILLFCAASAAVGVYALFNGAGPVSDRFDHILSILLMIACGTYLYVANRTVYGTRGAIGALKAVVLTAAVACTILGYRFALLLITLSST